MGGGGWEPDVWYSLGVCTAAAAPAAPFCCLSRCPCMQLSPAGRPPHDLTDSIAVLRSSKPEPEERAVPAHASRRGTLQGAARRPTAEGHDAGRSPAPPGCRPQPDVLHAHAACRLRVATLPAPGPCLHLHPPRLDACARPATSRWLGPSCRWRDLSWPILTSTTTASTPLVRRLPGRVQATAKHAVRGALCAPPQKPRPPSPPSPLAPALQTPGTRRWPSCWRR